MNNDLNRFEKKNNLFCGKNRAEFLQQTKPKKKKTSSSKETKVCLTLALRGLFTASWIDSTLKNQQQ